MLSCIDCVVQHVSCLANVPVLSALRRLTVMEKGEVWSMCTMDWESEGRTRRLGLRV